MDAEGGLHFCFREYDGHPCPVCEENKRRALVQAQSWDDMTFKPAVPDRPDPLNRDPWDRSDR